MVDLHSLYSNIVQVAGGKIDVGTYEQFESAIKTPNGAERVYNNLAKVLSPEQLGTLNDFINATKGNEVHSSNVVRNSPIITEFASKINLLDGVLLSITIILVLLFIYMFVFKRSLLDEFSLRISRHLIKSIPKFDRYGKSIIRTLVAGIVIVLIYLFALGFRYEKIKCGYSDVAILDKWTGSIERIRLK